MNAGNEQFERDFEAFLRGDATRLSELYRKLPQVEPDAQLDTTVRAMAQRSVAAQIATRKPAQRRWMPALASGAIVALAVGAALRLTPQVWQRPPSDLSVGASMTKPDGDSTMLRQTREQAPSRAEQPAALPAVKNASGISDAAPAPPPPPAAALPAPIQAVAPKAAPEPFAGTLEQARVRHESTTPAEAGSAQSNAASVPLARQPTEDHALAPRPDAGERATLEERAAAPAAKARTSQRAVPKQAVQDAAQTSPQAWIADIRELLAQGRRSEALQSLARLRAAHPQLRLPEDLRALK